MKTVLQLLSCFLLLLPVSAISADCVEAQNIQHALVVYRPESNQLKISAGGNSLDSILSRLSEKTGIRFLGETGRCDRVSINFDFLDLDRALAQLLSGRSYVVQDRDDTQAMRVWLLPAGRENGLTGPEILRDEFYRQLSGSASAEELADLLRQMELEP